MDEILSATSAPPPTTALAEALPGEDIFAYLIRTHGAYDRRRFGQLLGAANEHKEGDVAVGVGASDDTSRGVARALLRATTLGAIDEHPLFDDQLSHVLSARIDPVAREMSADTTLGELATMMLRGSAESLNGIARHLSSEVIGCVVKLLTNDELIRVSAKFSHALPGSSIGAAGFLGARLQPNSPTDHPDDIRWQVFDGWSYGVGDVLLGTNPVSSDPRSVAVVERTLQDVIRTFDLEDAIPHCVLAHIDVQAEVERTHPGSTALWFQSIAGSDVANQTFDVTVDGMIAHAATRDGPFSLYFETGQGADCTNGHANGVDMVIHESRKYGFARLLGEWASEARQRAGREAQPWVIVNDVAGFIGPEVFRTREQLVRCCLEDLVMGKLHGLTIGLDVCATLHMDISLDDLDWCLEQVLPACPAYLMALPTKVDPMLGYLTTGFQDHVRLREQFGKAVNPPMQVFFESLGVLDAAGRAGPNFGDSGAVFIAYQRRRGDTRPDADLRAEAARQMAEVRARGIFIAEGCGERNGDLSPALDQQIRAVYDDAKLAFWATLPSEFVERQSRAVVLETQSTSREDYILHPVTGEHLSARSVQTVATMRALHEGKYDLQILVSDGLNALAIIEPDQLAPFVDTLRDELADSGWQVAPQQLVIHSGRVRAGYRVGETLFEGRRDRCAIVHIIGERPGTGHHTFSAYVTVASGAVWSEPGRVDHDITRVFSGIAKTALAPVRAAGQVAEFLAGAHGHPEGLPLAD